ncbi:MAG: cation transporter [Flavobacterium sp.]|nr:MAG: cation transporter [Flavobacterium sp.]
MKKTIYRITQMDCASEEQLIRMKLSNVQQIQHLDFDIPQRKLEVFHTGDTEPISNAISELNLGSSYEETTDTDETLPKSNDRTQRKLLWQILLINLSLFALEMVTGLVSNSMGLVADSLDMLADGIVYALALFAVGGTALLKGKVAKVSGYLQILLAVGGFIEVIRRFFGYSDVPEFKTMIIISLIALTGNAICLYLLQKSRSNEAHMQASMIFTSNDVIVNLGVILAGILVYSTGSKFPDLIIGVVVFAVVGRGALKILKLK